MRARGATLIEMIIVIAITGIIAAAVAVFISRPVEGYVDAARRAELTDIADTALRRMTRDLRTALPNSIRIKEDPLASGIYYLEYLQSSGGGRYRAEVDSTGAGNILDFTNPAGDLSFDVIGTMPTFAGGESIVIYNLAFSGATANAYAGDNLALVNVGATTATTITLNANKQFPFRSPGKRFQVAQYAVTYGCNPATGELRRYWDYGILSAQPTPPVTANNALLATDIAPGGCGFTYATSQRTGIATLSLKVARSGESIQLFQQVHVDNAP
jgi:MSHA biogenesis protein MshO